MSEVLIVYAELYELYEKEKKLTRHYLEAMYTLADRLRDVHDESTRLRRILLKHSFNIEAEQWGRV